MCGLFPGESRTYSSAASIQGAEDGAQYPVEYLNSINTGGLPPSQLEVLSGRTLHGDVWRTGVDGRDLASTYVLRPLTIALS